MEEIWKDIKGYEGLYQISNLGNVMSLHYGRTNQPNLLKPQDDHKRGYLKVGFHKNGEYKIFSVHRLVAETFILDKTNFKSMPDEDRSLIDLNDLVVNHKDEIKTNNNVSNLEWCTPRYNLHYGMNIVKQAKSRYIPINQYDLNGNFIMTWDGIKVASETLKINACNITKCCKEIRNKAGGYIWKYADK